MQMRGYGRQMSRGASQLPVSVSKHIQYLLIFWSTDSALSCLVRFLINRLICKCQYNVAGQLFISSFDTINLCHSYRFAKWTPPCRISRKRG
jgi:hypothetical protein